MLQLPAQVPILKVYRRLLEPFRLQWVLALKTPRMTEEMRHVLAAERAVSIVNEEIAAPAFVDISGFPLVLEDLFKLLFQFLFHCNNLLCCLLSGECIRLIHNMKQKASLSHPASPRMRVCALKKRIANDVLLIIQSRLVESFIVFE